MYLREKLVIGRPVLIFSTANFQLNIGNLWEKMCAYDFKNIVGYFTVITVILSQYLYVHKIHNTAIHR